MIKPKEVASKLQNGGMNALQKMAMKGLLGQLKKDGISSLILALKDPSNVNPDDDTKGAEDTFVSRFFERDISAFLDNAIKENERLEALARAHEKRANHFEDKYRHLAGLPTRQQEAKAKA